MRLISVYLWLLTISGLLQAADYSITKVGSAIAHPWGMAVLSSHEVLVTARSGSLIKIDLDDGSQTLINPVPEVLARRQGGMLDVAVRGMIEDPAVYVCYSKPLDFGRSTLAISKGVLRGVELQDLTEIFESNHQANSGVHYGCRLVIDEQYLYAALGDRGDRDNSQDTQNHAGSIVRINLSAVDERANNVSDWLPELYSIGHRNPQGMAKHPSNGKLYAHEHGPRGGDEINLIEQNQNYGWPTVSYGKEYIGGQIGLNHSPSGFRDPIWIWDPSIAPSGMLFYDGDMFPEWKGDLLVGALKYMSIYQVELDENQKPVRENRLFEEKFGRVRDIEQAPDGSLLVLNDAPNGGLYRVFR